MILCIPLEARVRTIIRASFIVAKRTSETRYSLSGDSFQMSEITSDQVIILPDTVDVAEGQAITDELLMQALPIESFITVSAEEALPNALGLLLRLAVADGRLTDEELLSIQPVLDGRTWRPGLPYRWAMCSPTMLPSGGACRRTRRRATGCLTPHRHSGVR